MLSKIKNVLKNSSKKTKKIFVSISMALSVAMMSCIGAFAAEDGSYSVTSGVSDVVTVVGQIWNLITSNPYLSFLLACGVVVAGIGVFKKLKRSSK